MYLLALKLYPRPFRVRFAAEMEEVFNAGLEEAYEQGVLMGFVLREIFRLPGSLVGVYIWSLRAEHGMQMATSSTGGGGTTGVPMPGEGWGTPLMAGLPHLLMGIIIVSFTIIGAMEGINQEVFGDLLVILVSLLLLGVLIYSIYRGWKRWSASWITYMFIFAVSLLSLAVNALAPSNTGNNEWLYGVLTISIPLMLAYLLYKIACIDRLRALLAALLPMMIIWAYFQEFVPVIPQALAWGWMFSLAFVATVMMLHTKQFSAALGLAMAVPILGGLPFVYLGVYMGGTLPFSEPGPNLSEVFRQYIPFLVMVQAMVLGPLLAVKLRAIGHKTSEAGGKIFYRLALGGLLLGLVFTLLQWAIVSSGMYIFLIVRQVGLIAAAVLYLSGFVLLVWAAMHSEALTGDNGGTALQLVALFILLPCVPAVIFLAIPKVMMDSYLEGWLLSVTEIAWVFAALWVVKD
jgi:hypothetical protein